MNMLLKVSVTVVGVFFLILPLAAETRIFIDREGRALEGELVSVTGDTVVIKRVSDGQSFTLPATNFSKADQTYFSRQAGARSGPKSGTAASGAISVEPPKTPPSVGSTSASTAPMRIEVKVYPNKNQKTKNNGYTDDKLERISYRVDIRNGEQQRTFTGGKATMMAFAENLEDRSEISVILRDDFEVTLKPHETSSRDTKEAKLTYDNVGYKYGFKYSGYILVLKGADGKTVSVVASSATVAKAAEEILKHKVNDLLDKNYKFVKKGSSVTQ